MVVSIPTRSQIAELVGNDQRLILAMEALFQAGFGVSTIQEEIDGLGVTVGANQDSISQINGYISGLSSGRIVFVLSKSDLPPASGGIITLAAGVTYYFLDHVDLTGDRLIAGGILSILGTSSETSSITSTGLGLSTPLLTSAYTIPVRFITFKSVGTGIYIDDNGGANAPLAIDWLGVNFKDVSTVGEIGTIDNFIFDTGALLNSQGLKFTGTIGTIGMSNSLFSGTGGAGSLIELSSTCVVTRRFRTAYSAVVAFGATVGYDIAPGATIPIEGFVLDTLNFAGGGTYISGLTVDDNRSRFIENRGVSNSGAVSNFYMSANATATTIAATGTPVKAAGATSSNSITQKFTNTDNRATYVGAIARDFKVLATVTATSGNNHQVGLYIAKNGTILAESATYITTNAGGRTENGVIQSVVLLNDGDYIEVFVENNTSITDVVVVDMNLIVEALN